MKQFIIIIYLMFFLSYIQAQETINDIDGNLYYTVSIGNQIWMVENLKVTHYNDGSKIPIVMKENEWSQLVTGAFCLPLENQEEYRDLYGLLYNYYAINDKRKLCPSGWRVPDNKDWTRLMAFLGGFKIAGIKMKDFDSNLWEYIAEGSNKNLKFSALPAGGRGRFGNVEEIGEFATWWSATPESLFYAWHWGLFPKKNDIRFNPGHKTSGFSVRCMKNIE